MPNTLHVLIVEDNPADAKLLVHELRQAGFAPDWKRVDAETDYLAELAKVPDLILADFSMPQFGSMRALELLRERALDLPFIIVSGSIGEDQAVQALKEGAADYLLKDRLGRLGQAVARALKDRQLRDEKRRAEQQLILQASALAAAANGIVITDVKGVMLWVNPAFTRMTGYRQDEVAGNNPRILKSGQHEPGFYRKLWQTILAGHVWSGEMSNRRKDGSIYHEEQTITPVRDAAGNISHFIAIKQDVTERRRAAEDLRKQKEALTSAQQRLQHIVDATPAVIYALKVEGDKYLPTWISHSIQSLTGFSEEEGLAPNWWFKHVHPEDLAAATDILARVVAEGAGTVEYRFRRKDGSYLWVLDHKRLIRDAAGQPAEIIGSWMDISQRMELEHQFRQAQKMEAFGQLAGGVAHDFNNLLTIINGYSDIILGGLRPDDPLHELIEQIGRAGQRATILTRQLLVFSRKELLAPIVLDVNEQLNEMEKMLGRLIGEDIDLTFCRHADLWKTRADAGQLEQVIMNLAINARDAMPQGGKLTIETDNVTVDGTYADQHHGARPGDHVLVAVSDTGCGMTPEVKARIFEPFFTTKGPEKGTGLGLATVYGIVKQSGGHIEVYSEPGIGTSFKVYLPREHDEFTSARSNPGLEKARGGTETLLLVEDEDNVRALARIILQKNGYKVLEAQDAGEALLACERFQEPIHLLVTDVVMPGLSGRELAERLAPMRPGLKVLFLSGYTDDAIVRHGLLKSEVPFLQKPFTADGLAKKVREVLDRSI